VPGVQRIWTKTQVVMAVSFWRKLAQTPRRHKMRQRAAWPARAARL